MVYGSHNEKKHTTQMKKKTKGDELPFSFIASEILSRVPAKSDIGRCRCVCKQWNSYLSTPMFNRSHLRRHVSINDYKRLLIDAQTPLPFNLNPNPNREVYIIASFDGLVCLGISQRRSVKLVFWNPFTSAYKKASSIPRRLRPRVFDTNDPFGFYIDSSNDYKLVCLIATGWAHVYSHRLDSWKKIECSFFHDDPMWNWSQGTFCGQCVYFSVFTYFVEPGRLVVHEPGHFVLQEPQRLVPHRLIICFDVETETFRKIPFPPILEGASMNCNGTLVVLNGCIHLFVSSTVFSRVFNYDMTHGEMWRLDDGDEWVKVAAYSDHGQRKIRRICTTSVGDWLAVLDEKKDSLKIMNMEDFTSHYRYFCSLSVDYRCSRVVYAETLVSPVLIYEDGEGEESRDRS